MYLEQAFCPICVKSSKIIWKEERLCRKCGSYKKQDDMQVFKCDNCFDYHFVAVLTPRCDKCQKINWEAMAVYDRKQKNQNG